MLIDCGSDLFLGDYSACDVGAFENVVHITRGGDLIARRTCRHALDGRSGAGHLSLSWREEEPLGTLGDRLSALIDFAQRPGSLLIHCRAGHCRSANLAVLLARVRGLDPFAAIDRINRERYRQVGGVPAWKWADLNVILSIPLTNTHIHTRL